ncbi:MAG: DUF2891 family protein [Planctomycetota bacterium]
MFVEETPMPVDGNIEELTQLALSCIHKEHPCYLGLVLRSDDDLKLPRQLTPVFRGAFDWHSAVHCHWTLVRALRTGVEEETADRCHEVLNSSLNEQDLEQEVRFVDEHPGFEIPYGRAWLLQLCTELKETSNPLAENMTQLETRARRDLLSWCARLIHPVRSGQHDQSMFSLGLFHDWAVSNEDQECIETVNSIAQRHHEEDRDLPAHFEPSNHDFLSPSLATVDLMRRILNRDEFESWIATAHPELLGGNWPTKIVQCPDPSDGKLSHLDGLNLSRSWMLDAIASALTESSPDMMELVEKHRVAGLAGVHPEHYSGSHWLASFAMYLVTRRWEITRSD